MKPRHVAPACVSLAQALARLALEMGRAAAFPAPRCNVSWLGGGRNNRLPLDITESDDVKQVGRVVCGRGLSLASWPHLQLHGTGRAEGTAAAAVICASW